MSRSYRKIRPTVSMVYSVTEVQALYDVCRNTVSNWVSNGLKPSDNTLPQLFRGAELKRFHAAYTARKQQPLRFGEFKCLKCGYPGFPDVNSVTLIADGNRATKAYATCCNCSGRVLKLLGATECDKVKECIETNTSLAQIDEEKGQPSARVGKDTASQDMEWFPTNDRIIHDWQAYAGRYDPKTVQAHLISIRDFERFLGGQSFEKVRPKDAGAYRDHLVKIRERAKADGGLSNSTVRHRASHLASFFRWLRGQSGYRRLSAGIPDYFALPRSTSAQPLEKGKRPFPSMQDAWHMVELMPDQTLVQRRDRSMVAFAFISGLRAGALTSLRLKHLNPQGQTVVQDARDMRAKNGKSYRARWFPRTDQFQTVFLAWLQELEKLGFQDQDALFPEIKDLVRQRQGSPPVATLSSSRTLQAAFARASKPLGMNYSPHSARHALKALGARVCRTQEERKAWSMNLGHADEAITERHYGKMSAARSRAIVEALSSDEVFTEEEKEIIIDYHEGRFARGSDAYRTARRLADKREKARGDDNVIE
ncbi:tyrosine-type recombinase/integrase [Pseudophaeobacter profundi]|uniref:tyrosine-type recombinase/integrase n=1 Tax=Pseudophaeobacter profundi TaxID=3034152 RepID=UPI0024312C77|nr:tyrosine-type recombinase/integrase [Pseudophaeobacter profundi]